MSIPLKARLARSFAELELISEAWERLAADRRQPEVFHTFAWARAWWKGYAASYSVFTPIIETQAGEVVAIWPLVRCDEGLRGFGHGASDNGDLLAQPGREAETFVSALELLLSHSGEWRRGYVANVSSRGILLGAAKVAEGNFKSNLEIVHSATGFVVQGDATHFKRLSQKDDVRGKRRKMERVGKVTFRHLDDNAEMKHHLAILQRQHIVRWALEGQKSSYLTSEARGYSKALVDELGGGPLRLGVLELDGLPIAYHMGFEFAGKLVWYKPTFDVDYGEYGAGAVLLQSGLQYCSAAGLSELDFTVGGESYKERFASTSYEYFQIYLYSRRSAAQLLLQARERFKRNKAAYDRVKALVSKTSDWLRHLRRVVARDGLALFAGKRVLLLFKRCIYRKDTIFVYHAGEGSGRAARTDLEIVPLRFSLLADAALLYPDHLGPWHIARFRKRLAAGDRAVVALREGRLAHFFWLRRSSSLVASAETGPNAVFPFEQEESILYDAWTAPDARGLGIYPAVLQWYAEEEGRLGRDCWVYCMAGNRASVAGIRKAGYVQAGRIVRTMWLGRIERCFVTRTGV